MKNVKTIKIVKLNESKENIIKLFNLAHEVLEEQRRFCFYNIEMGNETKKYEVDNLTDRINELTFAIQYLSHMCMFINKQNMMLSYDLQDDAQKYHNATIQTLEDSAVGCWDHSKEEIYKVIELLKLNYKEAVAASK
ncbi:hypothetical protein FCV62_18985 [Vibrio kanaloae]|uniref:hypothetical protein n=1 Tax=Vibrio kanaloae TaxID=170673 RepID=UPI0010BEB9EA|nr:hypothetical protein [Vibrio kanaloae]TKF76131.1 hypothetical protein FCV62_18985 [Vibrio kanaloae]